jgi:hypothetical protein
MTIDSFLDAAQKQGLKEHDSDPLDRALNYNLNPPHQPQTLQTQTTPHVGLSRLRPLAYGTSNYCELCRKPVEIGDWIGWEEVPNRNGGTRKTMYCADCHQINLRIGVPVIRAI